MKNYDSTNNYNEIADNLDYEEYVKNYEYMNNYMLKKRKSNKIIYLLIFIVLLSILLIGLGFYYSRVVNLHYTSGDLFVVHSKTGFGDTIKDFSVYTSENDAFNYTFYVENKNAYGLWYKVIIKDDYDNNLELPKADKLNINYVIEKNNEVIFRGFLNQKPDMTLSNSKLLPDSVDNYRIKLWSSNNINGYYKFKIFVEI